MSDTASRLAGLRPEEQRALLAQLLRERAGRPKALPMSFAQQRLWFLQQLDPDSPAYNIPGALRLRGRLDVAALERSLAEIARRHETLRTTFAAVEGRPVQVIAPSGAVALAVVDLTALPAGEREAEARRLAAEEALRPFDPGRGPLLRVTLLRVREADHVLLLTMHHIVSDAWSIGVVNRELAALYAAFSRGRPSPLPELPIQYADFAAWQREQLQGERLEAQLGYWRGRLAGLEPLELPADRPGVNARSYRGGTQPIALSRPLSEALKGLSRREGTTLFMTLLAAFQALLARYTGRDDVAVGCPIAGRTRAEVEGLIGFFINSLVLRTDLAGDPTFRELLRRVREVTLGAYAHQDLPFEKLVEELQPEREPGQNPLFGVVFALQNAPMPSLDLPGLTVSPFPSDLQTTRFDLEFHLWEEADGLGGLLVYGTDLFDTGTIARLLGHYRTLLEAAVADPDRRLSELPLLTAPERQQLLVEWNPARADYPRDRCIHELFEARVERAPDAVALVFEDRQLTYAELNRRANRLAHHLRGLGVGPDVLVGLCLERSFELVVGMLAILKAGGAYLPLDPAYPAERLAFMLADARVRLVLTGASSRATLPPDVEAVVCPDGDRPGQTAIDRQPSGNPPGGATTPEHLAYVTYTSGSTGVPKGAEIPHRSVPGYMFGADYARFDAGQTFLQYSSVSWDAFTLELWTALLHGARCVLYSGEGFAAGRLAETIAGQGVSTLWASASVFNTLLDSTPEALAGVGQVLVGGEALSVPHVRRALRLLPGTRLVNGYGPAECTVFACCYPIPRDLPEQARSVPIGRPIGDRRVYLLDRRLDLVPVGVPGELCIGGPAVARGYLGRPGLTAEKFVPDPFGGEPGARLYRTGDLARYRPDGVIEFLGRLDQQVKVRGFRVEPGEVEAALREHPSVREAAVVAREDAPGQQRLVAYLVPERPPGPSAGELRGFLRGRLPGHMIPAAFVLLDALPKTTTGKLDRRALPSPDGARPDLEAAFVPPRTAVEQILAGLWAELLRVERVGVHDSFFDLGGHSLLATQVVSRARDVFRVEVSLRTLLEAPTVADFARVLVENEAQPGQTERIARILNKVESMSAVDVQKALEQQRSVKT